MEKPAFPPPDGYPHLKYAQVERERRWLCAEVPEAAHTATTAFDIVDVYIHDSELRLRSAEPVQGGINYWRLSKKTQLADPRHRLITTIYVGESEYARLWTLGGLILKKRRVNFKLAERRIAIDIFEPPLRGLVLAEVEFEDDETMTAYPPPPFSCAEVTADIRYSGFALARLAASADPDIRSLVGGLA